MRGKHRGRGLFEAPDILDVFKTGSEPAEASGAAPDDSPQQAASRTATREKQSAEAIRLRRQGRTLNDIGTTLGMSTSWAQLVTKGVKRGEADVP